MAWPCSLAWPYTSARPRARARAYTHTQTRAHTDTHARTPRTRSSCAGGGRGVWGGAARANGSRGFQRARCLSQWQRVGGAGLTSPARGRAGEGQRRNARPPPQRSERAAARRGLSGARGPEPGRESRRRPPCASGRATGSPAVRAPSRAAGPARGAPCLPREDPRGPRSASALWNSQPLTWAKC